jgi:hypothetical protein
MLSEMTSLLRNKKRVEAQRTKNIASLLPLLACSFNIVELKALLFQTKHTLLRDDGTLDTG